VMKSVAEEFSVLFDSRALEWKITCGPGHKHVKLFCDFMLFYYSSYHLLSYMSHSYLILNSPFFIRMLQKRVHINR
jgi:hypothetical protein